MELEKYETQGVNGGVVDMRCLPEDGAEGACPARNLEGDVDGTMSLPEESGTEKQKPTESASSAPTPGPCEAVEGSEQAASDHGGKKDGVNDESGEIEDSEDESDDVKSDTSSCDSWAYQTSPLNLNYEALKHLVDHFLPGSHGTCIDITTLQRGTFHEIRVLHFEDGWSCIARFTRDYEMLQKTESELATIEYVRKNTTIPVPEIYFVNHNENHVVGAPFVLMERMDGGRLCDIWEDLSLEHKLDVMGQIAEVVGQLSEQKFDKIGSLTRDGTVGPMLSPTEPTQPLADHPFTSTIDYFAYLKDDNPERSEAARKFYPEVRDELRSFFE
jgi:hypothetical protein